MSVVIYRKDTGQPATFTHMIDARTGVLGGAYSWAPPPKPEEPKPVMREIKPEPIIEEKKIIEEPVKEEVVIESEVKRTPRIIRK